MDDKDKNKSHPWSCFLNARYNAILWMKEEMKYDDKKIAIHLSMDERQVYLIRNSNYLPIPEGKKEK